MPLPLPPRAPALPSTVRDPASRPMAHALFAARARALAALATFRSVARLVSASSSPTAVATTDSRWVLAVATIGVVTISDALPPLAEPPLCTCGLVPAVDDDEDPWLFSVKAEERGARWVWNYVEHKCWSLSQELSFEVGENAHGNATYLREPSERRDKITSTRTDDHVYNIDKRHS